MAGEAVVGALGGTGSGFALAQQRGQPRDPEQAFAGHEIDAVELELIGCLDGHRVGLRQQSEVGQGVDVLEVVLSER